MKFKVEPVQTKQQVVKKLEPGSESHMWQGSGVTMYHLGIRFHDFRNRLTEMEKLYILVRAC